MNRKTDLLKIGMGLVLLSVLLHCLHYLFFRNLHHTLIFLMGEIAFIPLEVALVTLVIDRLLARRERKYMLDKINMLIGIFYQELGMELLRFCFSSDLNTETLQTHCNMNTSWKDTEFKFLETELKAYKFRIDITAVDLKALHTLLDSKKDLMVNLIANPSLLGHDYFSELLMSVRHMHEELSMRETLNKEDSTRNDFGHLEGDLERVYGNIAVEWLYYMKNLKGRYPYLFVTAMINNPFACRPKTELEKDIRIELYTVDAS